MEHSKQRPSVRAAIGSILPWDDKTVYKNWREAMSELEHDLWWVTSRTADINYDDLGKFLYVFRFECEAIAQAFHDSGHDAIFWKAPKRALLGLTPEDAETSWQIHTGAHLTTFRIIFLALISVIRDCQDYGISDIHGEGIYVKYGASDTFIENQTVGDVLGQARVKEIILKGLWEIVPMGTDIGKLFAEHPDDFFVEADPEGEGGCWRLCRLAQTWASALLRAGKILVSKCTPGRTSQASLAIYSTSLLPADDWELLTRNSSLRSDFVHPLHDPHPYSRSRRHVGP